MGVYCGNIGLGGFDMDKLLEEKNFYSRRGFATMASTLGISLALGGCAESSAKIVQKTVETKSADIIQDDDFAQFKALETSAGGRLGALVLNTGTGEYIGHRKNEHFALCSTFKFALAGMILRGVDAGRFDPNTEVPIVRGELNIYSDKVRSNIPRGKMKIIELAQEAQITSDNIAANALIAFIGGPSAFTAEMRELGDVVTRIDDNEPAMNRVVLGDERNSTSPFAYAKTMQKYLLDGALSANSAQTLIGWMRDTQTGRKRIRASLPADWNAGDKTGTGNWEPLPNKLNDICICWPPNKPPHIIASFYEAPGFFEDTRDQDQKVLADVGKIALDWIMRN